MKTQLLLFLLLKLIVSQTTLIESFSETSNSSDSHSQGWQYTGSGVNDRTCGSVAYFDSVYDFSYALIDLNITDNHNELQISYDISCTFDDFFSVVGDPFVHFRIDGDIAHTYLGNNNTENIPCYFNGFFNTQNVSITYPHTEDSVNFQFILTRKADSNYCVLQNFLVQYEIIEEQEEVDPQYCFDNLGNLTDTNGTTLINNTCVPFVEDNEQRFNFTTSFLAPYQFDTDCFSLEVLYSNSTLEQGSQDIDEWEYDEFSQEIKWGIKLDDFVNKYNCSDSLSTDSAYIWLCEYQVNIYHQSVLQLEYKAKIQVTLNRDAVDDNISLVVLPNEIEGSCCENQLNVTTQLNICEDFSCSNYVESPYQFQRNEPFFVEQIIENPEFDHYYLKHVEAKLGPVLLQILQFDSSQPGKLRLELQASIALQGNILQVISQLHNEAFSPLTGPGTRRMMMSQEEAKNQLDNNDYKVASYEQIDVIDGGFNQKQSSNNQNPQQNTVKKVTIVKEESNLNNLVLLGVLTLLSFTIITILVTLIIKSKKRKQKLQQNQEQVKEAVQVRIDSQQEELAQNIN